MAETSIFHVVVGGHDNPANDQLNKPKNGEDVDIEKIEIPEGYTFMDFMHK